MYPLPQRNISLCTSLMQGISATTQAPYSINMYDPPKSYCKCIRCNTQQNYQPAAFPAVHQVHTHQLGHCHYKTGSHNLVRFSISFKVTLSCCCLPSHWHLFPYLVPLFAIFLVKEWGKIAICLRTSASEMSLGYTSPLS